MILGNINNFNFKGLAIANIKNTNGEKVAHVKNISDSYMVALRRKYDLKKGLYEKTDVDSRCKNLANEFCEKVEITPEDMGQIKSLCYIGDSFQIAGENGMISAYADSNFGDKNEQIRKSVGLDIKA